VPFILDYKDNNIVIGVKDLENIEEVIQEINKYIKVRI
jgi:hypothetical protein